MRVIFMGRKPAASAALRKLVASGADVVAVVAPMPPDEPLSATFWRPLLHDTASELGLTTVRDTALYESIDALQAGRDPAIDLRDIDLVISFLFWKKIRRPLIELPRIGCFNFHPGPLPEFRGRRGYNHAILEDYAEYGASLHWVSEGVDLGDVVSVKHFPIRPDDTALSLERRTMGCLLDMFDEFITQLRADVPLPRIPQGPGKSATKKELLAAMRVSPDDDAETLARKVRAFWYPPHTGATIEIGGTEFTLVDANTLDKLGRFLHGSEPDAW
ncbi:MAG TPA: formyltransferase family protein [Gemmatimonadaceae bacterium]|nr:formyltransferase family protein [Gemmatimonadaceae bacterium]